MSTQDTWLARALQGEFGETEEELNDSYANFLEASWRETSHEDRVNHGGLTRAINAKLGLSVWERAALETVGGFAGFLALQQARAESDRMFSAALNAKQEALECSIRIEEFLEVVTERDRLRALVQEVAKHVDLRVAPVSFVATPLLEAARACVEEAKRWEK